MDYTVRNLALALSASILSALFYVPTVHGQMYYGTSQERRPVQLAPEAQNLDQQTPGLQQRVVPPRVQAPARPPQAPRPNAAMPEQNEKVVGIMGGELGGTFSRFVSDLASLFNQSDIRVLAILGRGSFQNITDIVNLKGVDAGLAASDTLAYAKAKGVPAAVSGQIQYLFKLYDNEVHILAKDDNLRTIHDLEGKTVNIDVVGSGTSVTAEIIFKALGIKDVRFTHYDPALGIQRMREGHGDAAMYVSGKPVGFFANLQLKPDEHLHFVSIPIEQPLSEESYLPGSLDHDDYPALIGEGQNTTVDTIAVGVVLAVYNWPPGTQRYNNIVRFINIFMARFPSLLKPPYHPKWKEVNLRAEAAGWVRFAPAVQALQDAEIQFRSQQTQIVTPPPGDRGQPVKQFLDSVAPTLPPAEREKLFNQYKDWLKAQPE